MEAGARGHQNCHIWVTVSSTAINKVHTCAMNSIVSGYFLLGTCPRRPQLHRRGTSASYGTPVKSNRTLVKVRPKGTRLNYLPALRDCPSSPAQGADIQLLVKASALAGFAQVGTPHGYSSSCKAKGNSLHSYSLPMRGFPNLLNGGWFPTTSIRRAELPSPICGDPKEKRSWARQGKRGTREFGLVSFGSYSKLKCGAPTDGPAAGCWCPGAVKSLDMDDRVAKHPDSYMTAQDPCKAASAACP